MNKHIVTDNLRALRNEKNDICVSIIMPTHRLSPGRRTDPVQMEKAIQQVKLQLKNNYDQVAISTLVQAIDELYEQIDFMHNTAGIGMFVSQNVKWLIHFFFPVQERITISRSFDIRDVLYETYFDIPYVILMVSQKEARLFNARLNVVTEITDSHFPKKNEADYEYNRPSRGSSYVGHSFVKEFEKDKSISEEIRLKSFFRETDDLLKSYLNRGVPLIVTGENKDLAYFSQVTGHLQNIACNIPGNYMTFNNTELGDLTWKAVKLFLDNKKTNLVRDFKEKIGEGLGLTGIENIWKAVQEGRGYKLLVEKDLSVAGYIGNNNDYEMHLHPPKQPHHLEPGVVNRLIEAVLEKNGEVIIMDNDSLEEFGRLALITRH
ncbi:hypothetical protein FAM09_13810 [Niastella caeni]|uniref:eRF1 domain-containing protein n=1 Tax=Niastella caeni TaxID=2569763 RepID=A0A4S8HVB8_9BACT|nr:hypothetical protein [Niastella caeni]THU39573.1 hypothetical protein FAM09_13810 [Niastella caeni]